jgi:hypothetical protein
MQRLVLPQRHCFDPSTKKMPTPQRGEVWLIAFGLTGKTRPAVVVSVAL